MSAFCNFKSGVVFGVVSLLASSVYAHGPQIQTGIENGRIVLRGLIGDEPYNGGVTPNQRVYEIPMAQRTLGDSNDGWYAQPDAAFPFTGPGIATSLGGYGTGSILTLTFTDSLKIWNGADFGDPGLEQFDAYRGAAHVAGAVTSDTGPFGSFSFTALTNTGDEHKTAFFRLLGDGISPNSASNDGIYLLSLQLQSDEVGVGSSEPYYFLFNKNVSAGDAAAALEYVNSHLVPEPTTLMLLGVSVCGLLVRRRRAA